MTAEKILAAMADAYARCESYCDSGSVRTQFLHSDGSLDFVTREPFETTFVRPNRFRFESSSHHPNLTEYHRYVISAEGGLVRSWWDLKPGVKRHDSLAMALAGATGVSGGSAHTVPALLLPKEIGGRRLTDLTDLTRLDDGDLGGTACYRVRGRYPGDPAAEEAIRREFTRVTGQPYGDPEDGPTVLWIEKGTLLLRRIEEGCRHGTTRWEMVTTYDPEVNVPIPDDHLEFDPPDTDDA